MSVARAALRNDLLAASFPNSAVSVHPNIPGDAVRGDVLWFLSAVDPATGETARKDDGTPFWQRNIIYYLATPTGHDRLFGVRCQATTWCPHKFLLRRVFDSGPTTSSQSNDSAEEKLMSPAQVRQRVGRPKDYGLEISGPAAEHQEVVATSLLSMQVELAPEAWADEIVVKMSGFDVNDAGKKIRLGREALQSSSYTHHILYSIFPGN